MNARTMWSQVQRESHDLPGKSPIWLVEPILQIPVSSCSAAVCSAAVQGLLGVQQSFASLARHSGEAACQGYSQVAAVDLTGTSGRCFPLLSGFTDRRFQHHQPFLGQCPRVYLVHNQRLLFHSVSSQSAPA